MAGIEDALSSIGENEPDDSGKSPIDRALRAIRTHLGMEVAYVSKFVGDESVYREVDAPGLEHLIKPGDSRSLDEVYCRHILSGRLPELIPDTSKEPLAVQMPITEAVPIGSHLSVPIRLDNGECYGMFCCLSPKADPSLNSRDHRAMLAFSELIAHEIGKSVEEERATEERMARIEAVVDRNLFRIVYQPICRIEGRQVVGFEALTRIDIDPVRGPDAWFAEAADVGRGLDFELAAIAKALQGLEWMPPDMYLTLNASPETVLSTDLKHVLREYPADRLVLEITEATPIEDYGAIHRALGPLRSRGVRLAVDDAGAGYASLRHISKLRPDVVKCDMSMVRDVHTDTVQQALLAAINGFATDVGCCVVAEGVECAEELACLAELGVEYGQGYFLGKPQALEDHLERLAA